MNPYYKQIAYFVMCDDAGQVKAGTQIRMCMVKGKSLDLIEWNANGKSGLCKTKRGAYRILKKEIGRLLKKEAK